MVATALSPIIDLNDSPAPEAYLIRTLAAGSVDGDYLYRLGSNMSAPLTAGWKRSARGAPGLPAPAAPSFVSEVLGTLYGLVAGGAGYQWAMTMVTASGAETLPSPLSSAHVMSAQGAATVSVPGVVSAPSNPAVSRGLYRTKLGGSTLYRVAKIDGVDASTVVDGMPDGSLIVPAPAANGTAIVSTISHVNGPLAAGGSGDWTQVLSGPASQQYAVDGPNGVLTFAAVDAGKTVTITYTAASRVEKNLMQNLVDRANLVRRSPIGYGVAPVDNNLTVPASSAGAAFGALYSYTTTKPDCLLMVSFTFSVKINGSAGGSGGFFYISAVRKPDGSVIATPNVAIGNVSSTYEGPLNGCVFLDMSNYATTGIAGTFQFQLNYQGASSVLFNPSYGRNVQDYNINFVELAG